MRTLFILTHPLREPLSGHDIRVASQLRVFRSLGTVDVFYLCHPPTFDDQLVRLEAKSRVDLNPKELAEILLGSKPPFHYRRTPMVTDRLLAILSETRYANIVFAGLETTAILSEVKEKSEGAHLILDLDESAYRWNESFLKMPLSRARRLAWQRYFPLLQRYESEVMKEFSQIWVSSSLEKDSILERIPLLKSVVVVPNSLDSDPQSEREEIAIDRKSLLFVGTFSHIPNQIAARELISEIMPLLPDFTLEIVGRDLPQELIDLGSHQIRTFSGVRDLLEHYRRATVAVMPIRSGAGTRIKAIEAMAMKVPIVATEFAVEGLRLKRGVHYLRAETSAEFASAVRTLSKNTDLQAELMERALEHYRNNFSAVQLRAAICGALLRL